MSRSQVTITITITDHAFQRAKERMGFDRKATERIAMKAFVAGKRHTQCKGQLKKYLDTLYLQYQVANNMRVYGEAIYLFANNRLVTIYNLPNEYKSISKK
jgi:hypothetical protein